MNHYGIPRAPQPKKEQPVTTDPEEGHRQIEATKPERLKVGDRVRLKAGGAVMTVVALEDYGNNVVCTWEETRYGVATDDGTLMLDKRDTFPAASLVKAEDGQNTETATPGATEGPAQDGWAR